MVTLSLALRKKEVSFTYSKAIALNKIEKFLLLKKICLNSNCTFNTFTAEFCQFGSLNLRGINRFFRGNAKQEEESQVLLLWLSNISSEDKLDFTLFLIISIMKCFSQVQLLKSRVL